ncbi:28S ribosomal protein S26, mitochondrial-like [Anneissia japonica]|uniref:28S ribosomal protein S26, mitochondrial-like n=1 Tax=Anneissia japonica TaxID=1529436 RepID=UPI0014257E70|nr:28S ribosomal protein S26, mitochondrial-like [Anneissia japonica]XP_033098422.1 28S ribosomal protein S26, mitochondrial-like [Anneissia japonica]
MLGRVQVSLVRLLDTKATYEAINRSAVLVQQVRWRKMRTDPINKSKIGRVRERTPIDPWEYEYLKTNIAYYRTTIKSLRLLFQQEFPNLRVKGRDVQSTLKDQENQGDDEEFQKILSWNEEENKKTKELREAREAEENREKEEMMLQKIMKADEQHAKKMAELEELVKNEMEASKNFITLENMAEKIEEAIDNKKNYNFLINKTGKIILPEDTSWTELRERIDDQEQNKQSS